MVQNFGLRGDWTRTQRYGALDHGRTVTPLAGYREMIVIQPKPGTSLPAGRYALVLNGYGFDFTVAGTVTAQEQCLEQVEVLNGTVLSECPKV